MARGQAVSSNENESSVIEPSAEASTTDSVVMIESTGATGSAAATESVVPKSADGLATVTADGLATVTAELEVVTEGGGTEKIATETESTDRPTQTDPSAEAPPTGNTPSEVPPPEDRTTKGSDDSTSPPPEVIEQCYRPTRLFSEQGQGLLDTVQSILRIQQGLIACSKEGKGSSKSNSMETTTQVPSSTETEEQDDHSIRGIPLNGKEGYFSSSHSILSWD